MNICVCIKQVPNTTQIKIDPVTGVMDRTGIPSIMNPDDKVALEQLEAAKELAKKLAEGQVKLAIKVGKDGRAFGSVSSKEIAAAVKAQMNLDVDKKKIKMDGVKNVGSYPAEIRLMEGVIAKITVVVEGL